MKPILTAKVGTNADLFPDVLSVHVPEGSKVLDMTYGRGVFWKNVDVSKYRLTTMDLLPKAQVQADFRALPFTDASFDACVLDPPYMHASGTIKSSIAKCYENNQSVPLPTQKSVRQLYADGMAEARRVLVTGGPLILKCQDMIESGKPNWNHVTFMQAEGWICDDLFVMVQNTIPTVSPRWKVIRHARKNHSYFIVLRKK